MSVHCAPSPPLGMPPLRVQGRQPLFRGRADATLGDEPGDEAGGGDVEGVVGGGAAVRHDADGVQLPGGTALAADHRHLIRRALFDGNLCQAVLALVVQRGGAERYIEGDAAVLGGQRLEVRPDLVGDVTGACHAVRADYHHVDHAVLHQMSASVVRNHGVVHALLQQLPGSEGGALVARPRLIHPHVHLEPGLLRGVDGARGGAVVRKGQPACIAVCQDVERVAGLPVRQEAADDTQPMLPDALAPLHVLVRNPRRRIPSRRHHRRHAAARCAPDCGQLPLHGPLKVGSRGARARQLLPQAVNRLQKTGDILLVRHTALAFTALHGVLPGLHSCAVHPVASSDADASCAAHVHVRNGAAELRHRPQGLELRLCRNTHTQVRQ
mmetsp:Transcript_24999/g.62897  ORF Transcript_24999/g.62897 Transcript_24999/m.62897 type:complete len:383 (-) Transcript_24999:370-1518(-)